MLCLLFYVPRGTWLLNISGKYFFDYILFYKTIENLFNNVCKYSMENTRVFVDLSVAENRVNLSIKNTSRRQMDIQADDLTERFIRGDSSRSTEGSGLGLSIAKSLTQAQGGTFEIQLEGDLFKVYLSFELKECQVQSGNESPYLQETELN